MVQNRLKFENKENMLKFGLHRNLDGGQHVNLKCDNLHNWHISFCMTMTSQHKIITFKSIPKHYNANFLSQLDIYIWNPLKFL